MKYKNSVNAILYAKIDLKKSKISITEYDIFLEIMIVIEYLLAYWRNPPTKKFQMRIT